jgi:Effector Associated Constant Component 1
MDKIEPESVELSVSDLSQLGSLADYLRLMAPDVRVTRRPGQPRPGEQGALDVLMIMANSAVLVATVKVLPEFLRSRRSGLSISMTFRGHPLTITATNIGEVTPIVDRLLDD